MMKEDPNLEEKDAEHFVRKEWKLKEKL